MGLHQQWRKAPSGLRTPLTVRQALGLDKVPAGVGPDHNDEIIYDLAPDKTSASGFGHPLCKGKEPEIAEQLHAGFVPRWAKVTK